MIIFLLMAAAGLVWFAVLVGVNMDTERQRQALLHVSRERRGREASRLAAIRVQRQASVPAPSVVVELGPRHQTLTVWGQ
jgi:hypothetical protein